MLTPFHLAINVTDLDQTRGFYGDVLGAKEGRSTETWVDFDFFWPSTFVSSWASFENRKHRLCGGVLGADATFWHGYGPA